ncbi:MAG: hypothetical protein GX962_15095 [Epulopiscium sp.]|nr:hypothetical protein [Candidatus Epulonipiscium sp.]
MIQGIEENEIIVTASYYQEKYFFNPQFASLPTAVQEELTQIAILVSAKIRGIFIISFSKEGTIVFQTRSLPGDYDFDEIGGELEIKKIQKEKAQLLYSLKQWYQLIYLAKKE